MEECSPRLITLSSDPLTRKWPKPLVIYDDEGFPYCGWCKRISADRLTYCPYCQRFHKSKVFFVRKGVGRWIKVNYECEECGNED